MKIRALKVVKYQGKLYQPGEEVDVKKEIAEELIGKEAVIAVTTKGEGNELNTQG